MYYSIVGNMKTMDYKMIEKDHKRFNYEMELIKKYLGFDDWNEMIKSIERENKIVELLQILQ